MLDLELLKTFVCVVDEGSFTRAAERVHRTQSTVSQQVRKLEELVGHSLLMRDRTGQNINVTEHGEMLIHYARRLLALSSQAMEALASDVDLEILRIGVPEDFDARRMALILAGFNRQEPRARLETVSGMSTDLKHKLANGDLDIALVKREPDSGPCWAAWGRWWGQQDAERNSRWCNVGGWRFGGSRFVCLTRTYRVHRSTGVRADRVGADQS